MLKLEKAMLYQEASILIMRTPLQPENRLDIVRITLPQTSPLH